MNILIGELPLDWLANFGGLGALLVIWGFGGYFYCDTMSVSLIIFYFLLYKFIFPLAVCSLIQPLPFLILELF